MHITGMACSQAADKAPDEDQQVQLEQLVVEMDDLVERLRSKVAWLDMVSLPAWLQPLYRVWAF